MATGEEADCKESSNSVPQKKKVSQTDAVPMQSVPPANDHEITSSTKVNAEEKKVSAVNGFTTDNIRGYGKVSNSGTIQDLMVPSDNINSVGDGKFNTASDEKINTTNEEKIINNITSDKNISSAGEENINTGIKENITSARDETIQSASEQKINFTSTSEQNVNVASDAKINIAHEESTNNTSDEKITIASVKYTSDRLVHQLDQMRRNSPVLEKLIAEIDESNIQTKDHRRDCIECGNARAPDLYSKHHSFVCAKCRAAASISIKREIVKKLGQSGYDLNSDEKLDALDLKDYLIKYQNDFEKKMNISLDEKSNHDDIATLISSLSELSYKLREQNVEVNGNATSAASTLPKGYFPLMLASLRMKKRQLKDSLKKQKDRNARKCVVQGVMFVSRLEGLLKLYRQNYNPEPLFRWILEWIARMLELIMNRSDIIFIIALMTMYPWAFSIALSTATVLGIAFGLPTGLAKWFAFGGGVIGGLIGGVCGGPVGACAGASAGAGFGASIGGTFEWFHKNW